MNNSTMNKIHNQESWYKINQVNDKNNLQFIASAYVKVCCAEGFSCVLLASYSGY